MKKLFPILLAALVVASTVPAHAGPLIAAVAAVFVAVGVGATTATILAAVVVTVGLSMVASALKGGSSGSQGVQDNPFGIKSTLQTGGVVARSFGFGKFCTAGSEIYPARTWGESGKTPNAYLSRFIALSDLPIDSLTAIIVDDQRCTYGDGTPDADLGYAIPEYNAGGADHLWVKFYDGSQTIADSWAVSQFAGDPDYPYGSDQVGYGVAYVIVTALIDQTLFSSFPQYKFEALGVKLYDPRADTSVGGSGSQRWALPATWEHTYNPAVVKYNVLRGISYFTPDSPPTFSWLFGLQGTDEARLPLDSWFAAMNVDDDSVETEPGVFAPQYQCGGEVEVNQSPAEFLDELNKCDNGRIAEAGGIFKTRSGAASSAVLSFTDADLIITAPQVFDMFPGLESTINGVSATYHDPIQNWAETDAPSLFDPDLEDQDGGRRLIAALQFNYVFSQPQVQRLMQAAREEARKFRKHSVIAPPIAFSLEPLDVIAWTSTTNGYVSKLFSVVPTDQSNLDQGLVLLEVDPADYDWDSGVDFTDYTPITPVYRPPASQSMSGWAVTALTLSGAGTRARAVIKLEWEVAGIHDVDGVQYEVRLASDSSFVRSGETLHFTTGYIYISENILSATTYEVRGRYLPIGRNRETDWSSWLSVTTPDVRVGEDDIEDGSITALKFAAGLTQVQVVSSLPGSASEGDVAVRTSDGKLFRYHSGAWTAAVPTLDLTGTITAGQIAAGAVDITKFAAGLTTVEIVGTLPTTGNFDGRVVFLTTDKKLYRYSSVAAAFIKSVDGADLVSNSVTTGSISVGAINAAQIAAGAVSASKMFIGSTDNLFLDGNCVDASYWAIWNATSIFAFPGFGGSWITDSAIRWESTSGSTGGIFGARGTGAIACQPGDEFFISCNMGTNGYNADLQLAVERYDSTGADLATDNIQTLTNVINGPHSLSGNYVVPAGVAYIGLFLFADYSPYGSPGVASITAVTAPVIRRRATGSLIVDGAITASKIGAGEVVAGKLAANSVEAGNVAANAIQAGNIDADAVTAGSIAVGAVNATAIIVSDIIVTGHIQANQITAPSGSVGSSHAITAGGGYDNLTSLTKTLSGTGDVLVSFTDYITWSINGPRGFYRIIDDLGNVIMSNGYGGGSCPDFISSAGSGLDTNGRSGSVTYYLQANWAAGANQPTSQQPSLVVTELKK